MTKIHAKQIIENVERSYLKSGIPSFRPGDTVRVQVKVVEGESERIQSFEGVVLSRRGSGISETFTVRKTSFGIGVERTFPIHSPRIDKIEVVKSGHSRRAKLYYLRKLSGKAARLAEKEEKETSSEELAGTEPKTPSEPKQDPQKKDSPEPVTTR